MPNVKSAEKRARTSREARIRNRGNRSRLRTALKRVRQAESADAGRGALRDAESLLDRMAGKGIIHANTAARHKSRLHALVARRAAE